MLILNDHRVRSHPFSCAALFWIIHWPIAEEQPIGGFRCPIDVSHKSFDGGREGAGFEMCNDLQMRNSFFEADSVGAICFLKSRTFLCRQDTGRASSCVTRGWRDRYLGIARVNASKFGLQSPGKGVASSIPCSHFGSTLELGFASREGLHAPFAGCGSRVGARDLTMVLKMRLSHGRGARSQFGQLERPGQGGSNTGDRHLSICDFYCLSEWGTDLHVSGIASLLMGHVVMRQEICGDI